MTLGAQIAGSACGLTTDECVNFLRALCASRSRIRSERRIGRVD
jgi:hypothetical protein